MYLTEVYFSPICQMWELLFLFVLTASRLEGGLILHKVTVIHSGTWRTLYPSVWPRLTWAGAGHPQPAVPAVAVWQGWRLGLGNAWFPAGGGSAPGAAQSGHTGHVWHMVSAHLPPHGTSFLEVPLPSLPILVHSPTPHPGRGAFSALLVRSGISFPSGLPQTKRELHRSCNHK